MRKLKFYLVSVILVLFISVSCKKSKYDSDYYTIDVNGKKRKYLLHKPDNYDNQSIKSLIIALHGGVGKPKHQEEQSQLSVLSDKEGFLVCYPEGIKRAWNAGGCCGKPVRDNIDDVSFISKLIDKLISEYNVNPKYVFVTGMSNGGFMSYRLACEISEKIAAIAPVAGSMNVESCTPSSPVSVIHFHSSPDENVPYQGGVGNGISDHYNPPIDSVLNVWANNNSCNADSIFTTQFNNYTLKTWNTCNNSTEIHYYITTDGGHSWPGGKKLRKKADPPSQAIVATELMWQFFKTHPKP